MESGSALTARGAHKTEGADYTYNNEDKALDRGSALNLKEHEAGPSVPVRRGGVGGEKRPHRGGWNNHAEPESTERNLEKEVYMDEAHLRDTPNGEGLWCIENVEPSEGGEITWETRFRLRTVPKLKH